VEHNPTYFEMTIGVAGSAIAAATGAGIISIVSSVAFSHFRIIMEESLL